MMQQSELDELPVVAEIVASYDEFTIPMADLLHRDDLSEDVRAAVAALRAIEAERDGFTEAVRALDEKQAERDVLRTQWEAVRQAAATSQDLDEVVQAEATLNALGTVDARVAELRQGYQRRIDYEFPEKLAVAVQALDAARDELSRWEAENGHRVPAWAVDARLWRNIAAMHERRMNAVEVLELLPAVLTAILNGVAEDPAKFRREEDAARDEARREAEAELDARDRRMTTEEARRTLPEVMDALRAEQAVRDAQAVGNRGIQEAASIQADTNFILSTGIAGSLGGR